jgi:hypothetical protein
MLKGIIEGFYGRPWTWDERIEVARWCAERGMTDYVHAPKDDPFHRERWRDPWPAEALDGFRRLSADGGLRVGVAISPGLSIDYASEGDRRALLDKILASGADLLVLALDDIPNRPGLGEEHAALTAWLTGAVDATVAVVPTEYVGGRPTPYLEALATGVPSEVLIGWTGMSVMNDAITVADAHERATALGGRRPLLWDNFPVNDGMMSDRLFVGPLEGREPGLLDALDGYLANPMVQPSASMLPLASTAAWLRGEDPAAAWKAEADALGWRVFAEACDGRSPRHLVDALDMEGGGPGWVMPARRLHRWLSAAIGCTGPDETAEWVEQVHAEARLGLTALRVYAATKPALTVGRDGTGRAVPASEEGVLLGTMKLMDRWPALRRAPVSVLGVRLGFRPAFTQRPDGGWAYSPAALEEGDNALDALVRVALDEAAAMAAPGDLAVWADGERLDIADDGTFTARPGATVVARSGRGATAARGALSWGLDRRL